MYWRLKSYFNISRKEYRGMMVLLFLLFLVYLSPYLYNYLYQEPLQVKIEVLKPIQDEINSFDPKQSYAHEEATKPIQLFNFDPNVNTLEDWVTLGLSTRQAATILKYQSKGGKFYKKEDLKKIYSISAKQYNI